MAEPYGVDWGPAAHADLSAIVHFIAEPSAIDARREAAWLLAAASSLDHHPKRCRRVHELTALPDVAGLVRGLEIRELIVRPWRLMFVIDGRRLRIAAVVDSRRDAVSWLERNSVRFGAPGDPQPPGQHRQPHPVAWRPLFSQPKPVVRTDAAATWAQPQAIGAAQGHWCRIGLDPADTMRSGAAPGTAHDFEHRRPLSNRERGSGRHE